MWTTHVTWLLVLAFVAYTTFRIGVWKGVRDIQDDLEVAGDERDAALKQVGELTTQLAQVRRSRLRWRDAAMQAETSIERERNLSRRLMDRVFPDIPAELGDPMTVGEADRQAVEQRKRELEREAAMSFDGREPIAIADPEAEPPRRLTAEDGEDDDDPA